MSHSRRKSASQISRSISQLVNDLEELTDAELIKQVNDLKHQIKILSLENEILERTILRLEPSLINGVQQALEYAAKMQQSSSQIAIIGSYSHRSQTSRLELMSPSRMMTSLTSPSKVTSVSTRRVDSSGKVSGTVIMGSGPRINVLELSELVSVEMEIDVKFLENVRRKAAKQQALLKAQLEEIDIRNKETEKSVQQFNQDVIKDGWDAIAQRIPAEIWIRYMMEWVKVTDSHIGKLRLRTSTLNTQFSKLKGQIKIKAELSDKLRPVDFEKVQIENSEAIKTIECKLFQLQELKKMAGDANLALTMHKKLMVEQNTYLNNIIKAIKLKQRLTKELDKERDIIQVQVDSLSGKLDEVKKLRLAYEVPDVMDYVSVKNELSDLKHSVKVLENRLHVQTLALKSVKKTT